MVTSFRLETKRSLSKTSLVNDVDKEFQMRIADDACEDYGHCLNHLVGTYQTNNMTDYTLQTVDSPVDSTVDTTFLLCRILL